MSKEYKENELSTQEYIDRGVEHLRAIAERTEDKVISVDLTEEEMDDLRHTLQEEAVKLQQLKDDKKAADDEHKEKVKPHEKEYGRAVKLLRAGKKEELQTVYLVRNTELNRMEIYTEDGIMYQHRPLTPEEYNRPISMKFSQ